MIVWLWCVSWILLGVSVCVMAWQEWRDVLDPIDSESLDGLEASLREFAKVLIAFEDQLLESLAKASEEFARSMQSYSDYIGGVSSPGRKDKEQGQ